MSEPYCGKYELPQSMCDHCLTAVAPRKEPDLIPDSEVLARFPARFDKEGGCEFCGGDTEEGEDLCLTESYGYVHERHCEPWQPPQPDRLTLH